MSCCCFASAPPRCFLQRLAENSWWNLSLSAIAGAVLFLFLFPFWLLRKIGAGDVKLMAVAPLVAGGNDLLVFALALLVFALLTAAVVKNPMLLPSPAFRAYVAHLDRQRVVPFGVPIAAALVVTIVLQAVGEAGKPLNARQFLIHLHFICTRNNS